MNYKSSDLNILKDLLIKHSPEEGSNTTILPGLIIWKMTKPYDLVPQVYDPCLLIAAQGRKRMYLKGKEFKYKAGSIVTMFAPTPLECALPDATPEKPLLVAMIKLDLNRFSKMIFKMESTTHRRNSDLTLDNVSGIFSSPLKGKLLNSVIRLISMLDDPNEALVLGESVIDEIYFRILNDEQGGSLSAHLQSRGQIYDILKAIEIIHENLDKSISIDKLAKSVNMSSSGFHKKFKEVMHHDPLF